MRGPDLAAGRRGGRGRKEQQRRTRSVLDGLRPLSITLSSDLDVTDECVQRLMHLSRLDDMIVFSGRELPVPGEFDKVVRWRLEPQLEDQPEHMHFGAVVERDNSRSTYGLLLQNGWHKLADHASGGHPLGPAIWIDLQFHQSIGNDLFVTSNAELLEVQRHRDGGFAGGAGLVSPREGVTTVEAVLRSRDAVVPVIDHSFASKVDVGTFRTAVSQSRMPAVWASVRSSLSPSSRDHLRGAATRVLSILAFYEDLLVATDETHRLRLIEGDRFTDNEVLDRMMYHVRQAITLTTSCLDCIAWLAVELEGSSVERRQVAWRSLRSPSAWVKDLQNPAARSIAEAARIHAKGDEMDFVHHLRDAAMHRQPLAGACLEIRPSDRRVDVRGDLAITVIQLEESIEPIKVQAPPDLPGVFEVATNSYLMPHLFVSGLTRDLAALMNDVLGAADWPNSDVWWQSASDELGRRLEGQLLDVATWLFGDGEAGLSPPAGSTG